MKMIQRSLQAGIKFHCRRHRPSNYNFPMRSNGVKIGTPLERNGDWMVELPKGKAPQFIEHCKNAGVGFTLITGVYSGLGFAPRDLVLFDYEFDAEELQTLVDTFQVHGRTLARRNGCLPARRPGSLNGYEPR
ncbi:MAG: hypothetical protein WDM80_13975 [Limisphaerales bacterium]